MKLHRLGLTLSGLALGLILVSGPATRFGLVGFRAGLLVFAGALLLAIGAFTVVVVALLVPKLRGKNPRQFALPLALSLVVMAGPASLVAQAKGVTAIHDITTDLQNPPVFVDVIPLRKAGGAANPPEYPGAVTAAEQRRAYPDLQPLDLTLPLAEAFTKAAAAARAMGWEMVAENAIDGRIEATATSVWFGFKDDIVIRVAASYGGSRVDVRSKSRVGRSDLGANAARIGTYLATLSSSGGARSLP